MARRLTSDEVIKEVEFELAVGAVGRDELGQAIQAVQQYHNKVRGEAFAGEKLTPEQHEALNRQLQFNDVVLSILREAAEEIRALQLAKHNLTRLSPDVLAAHASFPEPALAGSPSTRRASALPAGHFSTAGWPDPAPIERSMTTDQLHVSLLAERSRLPLFGGFLTRLRLAAHRLCLFYVHQLAERQVEVNRVYGDALLTLQARTEAQEAEIDSLRQQLASGKGGPGEGALD